MRDAANERISRRTAVGAAGAALGVTGAALWNASSRDSTSGSSNVPLTGMEIMTPGARDSDLIPDTTLYTQSGRTVKLYSDLIKDSRILLSFMYVRCQGFCPVTSALFQSLRKSVMERLGPNVKFVSITLDAEYDTPSVLREYAGHFNAEDENNPRPGYAPWYFLTAKPETVDFVRRSLGHYDPDPVIDADRTQHATLFTFGNDTTNRWATMPVGLPHDQTLSAVMRFLGTSFSDRYSLLPRPA